MRLKHLRLLNDYTQDQLADLLFISVKSIHRYESGKSKPTQEIIARYAREFNVSADYILGVKL